MICSNHSHKGFLKLLFLLIYLFLAALGLLCCVQAFSSRGKRGLLFVAAAWASHCSGFACCGARGLGVWASVVVSRGL